MNERAATWGDLLARRNGHRVIGRQREIQQFRLNYLFDVPQTLLFVLQGPSGVGKSTLLQQYCEIAQEHGVLTAVVSRQDTTLPQALSILEAMTALETQLSVAGTPLTTFKEVSQEYLHALETIEADPDAPGHVWDLLGGAMDEDAWASRAWNEYLTRTFPLRRSALIRDPVGSLTERFVQDLNAWAMVRRMVLCFDDWHTIADGTMAPNLNTWLLDLLASGDLSTSVWFVLASQAPLPPTWEALSSLTTTFELSPLNSEACHTLLKHQGVTDADRSTRYIRRSQGNPLQLTMLAVGSENGTSAPAVESYIDSLAPELQTAVLKSAAARHLNEEVLTALLGEAAAPVQAWRDKSPLVVVSRSSWAFHAAVRDQVIALARERLGAEWEAAHRKLFAYYRQQLELRGTEQAYLDAAWRRDKLEALYHDLIAGDEREAMDRVLASFLHGIRHFYPWAGAVVQTWEEAAHARPASPEVHAWAAKMQNGWRALANQQWQEALAFIEEVQSTERWTPEVNEMLTTVGQLIAARLALPPKTADVKDLETAETSEQVVENAVEAMTRLPETPPPLSVAPLETSQGDEEISTVAEPATCEDPTSVLAPSKEAAEAADKSAVMVETTESTDRHAAVEACTQANGYLDDGAYEAAIRAYDRALRLDVDYVAAYYNRGVAYVRIGALDSAITDFTHVIKLAPEQAQAYRQRGLVYARKGEFARAIEDYDAALERTSEVTSIIYDRANAHFRLGAYDRAIEDYTAALAQDANHVEAHLNRGLAYAALGDYPEALRDYNRAIALAPERPIAYSHRGQAYARLGRYTEALADYDRALALNPRYAVAHNNRGLLYVKIEAYPEAMEAYQRAMALEPDWATPYYNAACAAALTQDVDRACTWLARAIGLRESYRAMAVRDTDLAALREHPRFKALVEPPDAQ